MREQAYDASPIFLWPAEEDYTNKLVHRWVFGDGSQGMVRWDRGFTLTLDGDLAEDARVVATAEQVIAELTRRTGLAIALGPDGECLVRLNPHILDDDAVAQANLRFRGPTIVGADVEFATRHEIWGGARADYRNTFLHEMGHVVGLGHSPSYQDVMTPGSGRGSKVAEFQSREAVALHMMYAHRDAGNRRPDRDVALGARSLATPVSGLIVN